MKRELVLLIPLAWFGCAAGQASDAASEGEPEGSNAVIQSGPQDIGEYRSIVDAGGIPATEVLDERGFFAEHKIDLPEANCGASVCVHPMLAVAPRFDGGNWSMAFVGMNTALDARTLPTKPRHLVLVGRLSSEIADIVQSTLDSDDLVSVVTVAEEVRVPVRGEGVDALSDLLVALQTSDSHAELYSGLAAALEILRDDSFADYAGRVLVFGGDAGLGPSETLEPYKDIAAAFAGLQVPVTVFVNEPDDVSHVLTDLTWGNHYFVQGSQDLENALRAEAETAFVPIARNLTVTVEAAPGYGVGDIYGAPLATSDGKVAVLKSPVAYIGARSASDDFEAGRRGGGGGWFVELTSDRDPTGNNYEDADAFTLVVEYEDTVSGESVREETTVVTPLGVGQNPPPEQPFFSDPERGKPFMMLNMYLALSTATMLANENRCGSALTIEPMMTQAWEIFTALFPDADIGADFALLKRLNDNIELQCQEPMSRYIDFPASCGYS